jgi:hypothetical protein
MSTFFSKKIGDFRYNDADKITKNIVLGNRAAAANKAYLKRMVINLFVIV